MNIPTRGFVFATACLCSCLSAFGADPEIRSTFVANEITEQLKGFRPILAELGQDFNAVKVMPEGLHDPLVGEFRLGERRWIFVIDEPEDDVPQLFVDSNNDRDLTNDPDFEYSVERHGNETNYAASVTVRWNDTTDAGIKCYRIKSPDPRRERTNHSMIYYPDFGYKHTLTMDGESYHTAAAGPIDRRVTFSIDRNDDGEIHRKLETIRVGVPFNYTGTTYVVSLSEGKLSIAEADGSIEQMPLPLDLSVGQFAPQFTATTMSGNEVKFPGDFAGKIVLLDFWATWCMPCVFEIPHMRKAYEKWHGEQFEILGVTIDSEGEEERLTELLKNKNAEWPQIYEGVGIEGPLARMYEISAVPFVLLVDGDSGEILATRKQLRGEGLSEYIGEHISKMNKQ
ncbi:TlpA family protein disulfide reductase [Rhodopirellula sallentina]|uniref:Thiol-disulfide oxidoreductase n=1 Tax=Rhodopirellula sallentina SM41 TaxID=1263870 RepID=M5TRM4_9BACT|nr:TlpA disulfide reductase family protein [Rhodopirellula sallentina]EMI51837.1 Thiol-disulfide oxidoreductase [Rhodopirellula sallentina SM41]